MVPLKTAEKVRHKDAPCHEEMPVACAMRTKQVSESRCYGVEKIRAHGARYDLVSSVCIINAKPWTRIRTAGIGVKVNCIRQPSPQSHEREEESLLPSLMHFQTE